MPIKIARKKALKKTNAKRGGIKPKPKLIDWDKYVGKIGFPDDAVNRLRLERDESR